MPVSRLQLSIMIALASEPLNGHAVAMRIRDDTEYGFIPSFQSVYQALAGLEHKRDIETLSTPKQIHYQLTPEGRRRLKQEQRVLELTLRALKNRS
jgi:DNA-binding PadR family transcriptional regulator